MRTEGARVAARILLKGQPLAPALARQVAGVLVRQKLGAPSLAEITFEQPPEGWRGAFPVGAALQVGVAEDDILFTGRLTGIEQAYGADGRVLLHVRAHDALHALRMRRRFRVVENRTVAQLWSEAAGEAGVACVAEPGGDPPRTLVQTGGSDLDLLLRAASDVGLYPTLDGTTLRLVSLAGHGPVADLRWGTDLLEARIDQAGERASRTASANGWSPDGAQAFTARVGTARQDEELSLDSYGAPGLAGDEGEIHLSNRAAHSEAETAGFAQAAIDVAVGFETVVRGATVGDPALRPGARVRLMGLADLDPVVCALTEAVHAVDTAGGYRTTFSTEPPQEIDEPPAAAAVTMGEVTDIVDPLGAGRCRVTLPSYGGLDVGFLNVVIPGAGEGKGAAALPDIGDRVAVLLPGHDLADGLILGGLYGRSRLPRGLAVTQPRAVVIASGADQRLVLDGRRGTASLSTARGDRLSLGTSPSRLAVAGDLSIEAVGGTITIKASRVRFERG